MQHYSSHSSPSRLDLNGIHCHRSSRRLSNAGSPSGSRAWLPLCSTGQSPFPHQRSHSLPARSSLDSVKSKRIPRRKITVDIDERLNRAWIRPICFSPTNTCIGPESQVPKKRSKRESNFDDPEWNNMWYLVSTARVREQKTMTPDCLDATFTTA